MILLARFGQSDHIRPAGATERGVLAYRSGSVIDLHCHVLPGIDDGPATIEDSIALVRVAEAAGTSAIVATSHVSWHYPNDAATIARLVDELNRRLEEEQIAVKIFAGAEIAATRVEEISPEELSSLHLGDGPWVLLEPPFTPVTAGLGSVVASLQGTGHRVVLAHPERCPGLRREPRLIESFVDGGVLMSITAGSLVGSFGGEVRRFALHMVEQGFVHNVVSDAHDAVNRPPTMTEEIEQAGLGELSDWLTNAVPAAILSGEEIPACPEVLTTGQAPARRWRIRRR
jgi:protein-tyrosine phosphatase